MREDNTFPFQAQRELSQCYLLMFILNRISSCLSYCEMMAQKDERKPIPIPPRGFLFSEPCETFATINMIIVQPAYLWVGFSPSTGH